MSLYDTSVAVDRLPMPESLDCARAIELIEELTAVMREIDANSEVAQFPVEALQQLFGAAVGMLAAKFDSGEQCLPLPMGAEVSATAIMVTATGLLKSANLELFELGMWQSWSGTR